MSLMLNIFLNNIFPLFFMVFLGILLGRAFSLDVFTMGKFNIYIFMPVFIFYQLYTTEIPASLLKVGIFSLILLAVTWLLSLIIIKLGNYPRSIGNAFLNSVLFFNSGNFGLPLITLIFQGSPWQNQAVTAQIMVLLVQNTCMNTLGFLNADNGRMHWKESLLGVLKMPVIYAVFLAFGLKAFPVRLESLFFWPTLVYLKGGMIPVALTLLGVQLGKTRFDIRDFRIYSAVLTRLLLVPAAAYLLIRFFGFTGVVAQTLLIGSGLPSAVTTALIALERDNEPEFASKVILASSFFCIFTLVFLITLAGKLFPV